MDGQLIVLEGADGAGTTTHSGRLASALRGRSAAVCLTAQPSTGPLGSLLRQVLAGRVVARGLQGNTRPLDWRTMALLFAADRMDHLEAEIAPNLRDGVTVVCDRYYHSTVAYQSLAGGGADAIPWLRQLNAHARVPDLTIVIDVPPEVAAARRRERPQTEIFDADSLQSRLCAFYGSLETYFPDERIVHVDGNRGLSEVAADIERHVMALRTR